MARISLTEKEYEALKAGADQSQVAQLKNTVGQLKENLKQKELEVEDWKDRSKEHQSSLDKKVHEARAEADRMKQMYQAQSARYAADRIQLVKAEELVEENRKARAELEDLVVQQRMEIAKLKCAQPGENVTWLQARLEGHKTTIQAMKDRIKELEADAVTLTRQRDGWRDASIQWRNQCEADEDAQNQELEAERQKWGARILDIDFVCQCKDNTIKELEGLLQHKEDYITELETQVADLQTAAASKDTMIKIAIEQRDRYDIEARDLSEKLGALENDLAFCRETNRQQAQQIGFQRTQAEQLQAKLTQAEIDAESWKKWQRSVKTEPEVLQKAYWQGVEAGRKWAQGEVHAWFKNWSLAHGCSPVTLAKAEVLWGLYKHLGVCRVDLILELPEELK